MLGILKYKHNPFKSMYVMVGWEFNSYYLIKVWPWKLFGRKVYVDREYKTSKELIGKYKAMGYIFEE